MKPDHEVLTQVTAVHTIPSAHILCFTSAHTPGNYLPFVFRFCSLVLICTAVQQAGITQYLLSAILSAHKGPVKPMSQTEHLYRKSVKGCVWRVTCAIGSLYHRLRLGAVGTQEHLLYFTSEGSLTQGCSYPAC